MNKLNNKATDKQLVAAIKEKNDKAFTIVYDKYHDDILSHLKYKTSNNSFLDGFLGDIVSETFTSLWENIINDKYEDQGYLKAYLKRMAFNKLTRRTNKKKQTVPIDSNDISDGENEMELMSLLDGDIIDYGAIAKKSINELNEICLQLIILKFYDKMSDLEIFEKFKQESDATFKNVRNIRSRRSHCMEKLRKDCDDILNSIA